MEDKDKCKETEISTAYYLSMDERVSVGIVSLCHPYAFLCEHFVFVLPLSEVVLCLFVVFWVTFQSQP